MKHKLALAGCIILDDLGRVLLLHRKTRPRSQWETPGGKIEAGEDPQQTARREVKEELGTEVRIIKELGRKAFEENNHWMDYTWYQAIISGEPPRVAEPLKFDSIAYFSWQELRGMSSKLSPNAQNLVDAYFSGQITVGP